MARFRPVDHRRGGGWGFLSLLTAIVVIGAAVAFVGFFAFNAEATRPGPSQAETAFNVERGASAASIGEALEEQGLIRDAFLFRVAMRAFAPGGTLQAGEYAIPPAHRFATSSARWPKATCWITRSRFPKASPSPR